MLRSDCALGLGSNQILVRSVRGKRLVKLSCVVKFLQRAFLSFRDVKHVGISTVAIGMNQARRPFFFMGFLVRASLAPIVY